MSSTFIDRTRPARGDALPYSVSRVRTASLFLRIALAAAFLSACADRFGLWGPPGAPHVAWGDFAHFTAYTARVNSFLPAAWAPALAWLSTAAEIGLALGLLAGLRLRAVAASSGALLLTFALAMTVSFGLKAPLDYSVFSAAAGAFLLAALPPEQ
jgi:uncharacterized membrane protein YphA (DoxX/SURF4 family)